MQQAMQFCDQCGAANTHGDPRCFSCQHILLSSPLSSPVTFTPVAVGNGAVAFTLAQPEETGGPLAPGSLLLQRYQIMAQVGTGGFGVVYKAMDLKKRKQLVAIKQIFLDQLSPRDIIQATDGYNREIKVLTSLRHENIPCIYNHFTDPHHWYIVLQWIEGETLEERCNRLSSGKLPSKEVLDIGIQLCEIFLYLHHHNIIFRDTKPANIMRTREGRVYLIDFGIARLFKPGKARDTAPLGTPGYAAPEQYGTAQTTERADIYSLGVTLSTLLTGVDPTQDVQDLSPETSTVTHMQPVPKKFQMLLHQMQASNINERPLHIGEVKRRLRVLRLGPLGHIEYNVSRVFSNVSGVFSNVSGAFSAEVVGLLILLVIFASFCIILFLLYNFGFHMS